MNMSTKIATAIVLTLGAIAIEPVLANGPMHKMHGMKMNHQGMMHGGPGMMRMMHADPEKHLQEMKTSLKLTAKQQPAWDAFEKAALAQMESMKGMRESMHGGPGTDDHMAQMETRFKGMKQVHEARQALLDVLTDKQKQSMQAPFSGEHCNHG